MEYNYIKALHLIFVITWFAGLFYIVRLFVYHAEAKQKPQPEQDILIEQYQLMQYRLWYIITWPSAVLASFYAFFYRIWKILVNPTLDACKIGICFVTLFVSWKMPSNL